MTVIAGNGEIHMDDPNEWSPKVARPMVLGIFVGLALIVLGLLDAPTTEIGIGILLAAIGGGATGYHAPVQRAPHPEDFRSNVMPRR